jgi:crossover junction endodeoxyribonuclease RusA
MSEPRRVTFTVNGFAQPKGSAKAFVAVSPGRAPRAIVTQDNARGKGWQQLVAEQAQSVAGNALFLGPVVLTVVFHLPRPVSLPQKVRQHTRLPDLDKLLRAVGDGLTGTVVLDDKQIVDIHARKCYADYPRGPHATITLEDAIPPTLRADGSLFS